MKKWYLLSVVLVWFVGAQAQEVVKQWSLQECINVALDNNLRVKRSLYGVESAKINLDQAKASFLPSANVNTSYGQNYGRALNPVTNSFIDRDANTINFNATSTVTLFNGLRIQNTFRQTSRDYDASNFDLVKAKNDVIINVVTLYTNVIFNKELYDNANYQLKSSQQQLDRIKKQVQAGALPMANELNQEATVATNEVNLINQENTLNLSILQLKQAMQIPGSQKMDVIVPELSVEDLVLDQSPEAIYEIAKQTMPEMKAAMLRLESAKLALSASKGNLLPRLTFSGSAQSNYASVSNTQRTQQTGAFELSSNPIGQVGNGAGGTPVFAFQPVRSVVAEDYNQQAQLKDNLFKGLSLNLSIPLFNSFQSRAAVQRAAVSNELANITKIETENTLRQTIESSYNDAWAASKSYAASLKQVNAREEAYRMNKQRFEAGALNIVEFQISENDLFQSKSDLTRSKYNFIFRKKVLDFYQGKPLEF